MDIEYIKEKIFNLDEQRKIQPGEYLSAEVIELLRQGNTQTRTACFAKTSADTLSGDICTFPSEVTCSCCGKLTVQHVTKTYLCDYLHGLHKILCDTYKEKEQQEKERSKLIAKAEKEKRKLEVAANTVKYINTYLDPTNKWDKDIAQKERMRLISNQRGDVNYSTVAKYIKRMPYQEFLRTMYWSAVSEHKKLRSNYKCTMCGSNKNLATHHSSYEKHGYEHEYAVMDNDLIVLCENCHSKFHDKLAQTP